MLKKMKVEFNTMLNEKELYRIIGYLYYEPMIMTYNIRKPNTKVIIPIDSYSFLEIHWDNNTINKSHSHVFADIGNYTVKIISDATELDYSIIPMCVSLTNVYSYGSHDFTKINFSNCWFLRSVPNYLPPKITSLHKMFLNCNYLNCDLSNYNTSNITDMSSMFEGCYIFNNDISNFDTSNVLNMSYMFDKCHHFNKNISNFITSKVIYMSFMFYKCYRFNQNIDNFDTSNVINMESMFYQCSDFNQPLNNFRTDKVKNMECMFAECSSFNQKLDNFDTRNVVFMGRMFDYCSNLDQDFTSFDLTSMTSNELMFYGSNVEQDKMPKKIKTQNLYH